VTNAPQWRSGFERRLRADLDKLGVAYSYEAHTYALTLQVPGHYCEDCEGRDIRRVTKYTPDFYIEASSLTVEAKGKFDARARKIALAFVEQYPEKNYALLFQRDNWISGKKKQRYSDWCNKHNIAFAVGKWPKEWLAS